MSTDGGQVQIRFTVANAEVVRQALSDLGTQGEKALKQFDASAQPVNGSMKMLSDVMEALKGKASGVASAGGPVSAFMMGLGPLGIVAGVGIGAAVLAIGALAAAAAELGEKAIHLQAFSYATGVATDEIQKLNEVGAKFGIENDAITTGVERFSANLDAARKATGPYYDMIREINPALAEQVLTTKGVSGQLVILAQAYAQAGEKGAALLKNALGRGGVAMAPLLAEIGGAGSINNIGGAPGLSADEVNRMAATTVELNASWERIKTNIGAIGFTPEASEHSLALRHDMEGITAALRDFSPSQSWSDFTAWVDRRTGGALTSVLGGKSPQTPNIVSNDAYPYPPKLDMTGAPGPAPQLTPEQIANQYKTYVSALGSAATVQEQFNVKVGDLNIALAAGKLSWADYNRALNSENLQNRIQVESQQIAMLGASATLDERRKLGLDQLAASAAKVGASDEIRLRAQIALDIAQGASIAAAREKLGIESEEALLTQRLAELRQQYADGFIKNDAEMAAAERYVRKEVRDTIDQMAVRTSPTPALKQLELDGANLAKTLDGELASGLRGANSDLIAMAKGTETTSQGLQNMGQKLLEAVANATLLKTVVGPLSSVLQSGFGFLTGAPTALGDPSGGSYQKPNALGNIFSGPGISAYSNSIVDRPTYFPFAAGVGLMGEAGAEGILPLRRNAAGQLGVSASGGSTQVINNFTVENHTSGQVTETKTSNSSGGFDHRVIIRDVVAGDVASGGPISRQMEKQYGLNRAVGAYG